MKPMIRRRCNVLTAIYVITSGEAERNENMVNAVVLGLRKAYILLTTGTEVLIVVAMVHDRKPPRKVHMGQIAKKSK